VSIEKSRPVRGDLPNVAKLAVLGMISGALSWLLIDASDGTGLNFDIEVLGIVLIPIAVYPGLLFGLFVGAFLRYRTKIAWLRVIGYVLAAGLGYLAAFHVAFYIVTGQFNDQGGALVYVVSGLPAGLAGSFLLGLLTKYLLRVPSRLVLGLPLAVGTVGGALLALANYGDDGWGFLPFFVLWQGAYGASLAPLLRARAPAA
jgi:hypothetical protein